ncbi:hypothetical protein QYE76_032249 [Lolium multiflorum]|uniref:Uncharacterized protein n=1 Tax=Lolium multiflorum TaxID=4521 RepID=A0AAD8QUP4_LOLMU|nr:hypothetical protein QYE76_032249 [Lolium multiflorum]
MARVEFAAMTGVGFTSMNGGGLIEKLGASSRVAVVDEKELYCLAPALPMRFCRAAAMDERQADLPKLPSDPTRLQGLSIARRSPSQYPTTTGNFNPATDHGPDSSTPDSYRRRRRQSGLSLSSPWHHCLHGSTPGPPHPPSHTHSRRQHHAR